LLRETEKKLEHSIVLYSTTISQRFMDTMRISGVSTGAEVLIQCNSLSSLVSRRCDDGKWRTRMFPARNRDLRPSPTRRSFLSVKSISSEPKAKVTDAVLDSEQGLILILAF